MKLGLYVGIIQMYIWWWEVKMWHAARLQARCERKCSIRCGPGNNQRNISSSYISVNTV